MRTRSNACLLLIAAPLFAVAAGAVRPQAQIELTLEAKKRLFPSLALGVRGTKLGPDGRYYILTAHSVLVFDAAGANLGEIPPRSPKDKNAAGLNYGEAFDVGSDGRIYVADRGANAIRVFSPAGELLASVTAPAPTGVVALAGGEFAVTSSTGDHLVSVYDMKGTQLRTFGDLVDLTDTPEYNRYLSVARLATDNAANIYLAFTFFPEPTVRKYDRFGYAAYESLLNTLEFAPSAQAARREIKRVEAKGGPLQLKERLSAIGVDPEAQTVWLAIGDELLRFDREGKLVMQYTLTMQDGSRFKPNYILVEHTRLILSTDSQGIYEFSRPVKDPALLAPAEKNF